MTDDDFVHIQSISIRPSSSRTVDYHIVFMKSGFDNAVIKTGWISLAQKPVDRVMNDDIEFQIKRRCYEAVRDYLFIEHGKKWREFETEEYMNRQLDILDTEFKDWAKFNGSSHDRRTENNTATT